MKGINYWRVREEAALKRYLAEETDYEARLEEIYKTAADNIEKEIQSLLSKYAATENITMADAKKRADRMDVEAFSRKAARYVKEKNFSEKANRELKLYNLKMKISRLELLKKHIELELIAAADEAERELRSELEKRARDELKRQAGILDGGTGDVSGTAKALANSTFYGQTFSERLWSNTEAMNKKLSALLSSGLIRGQNPRVLARSIRDQYIGPERLKNGRRGAVYAAERLMRTELSRVQTEAQLRSFEESGIEEYEFIATTNCCPICDALDGKHFKVRDLVAGENAPPMHPNCRCSTAPWVGEEDAVEDDDFAQAKSIKDAEKQAAEFFEGDFMDRTFKGSASYTGISLDHANQINRTLKDLSQEYPGFKKITGIKSIDPSSKKGKKIFTSEDAVMAYDPIQKGVYINRKVLKDADSLTSYATKSREAWAVVMSNMDKLSGAQRQVAQRYKDAGRTLVGDGSVRDYLIHEYGHHVAWEWLDSKTNNLLGERMSTYASKLSGYATTSKSEYLAESFVAYNKQEFGKVDPEYANAISSLKGRSSTLRINKAGLSMVDSTTTSFPTIKLSKQEYAHVMHELNQNLTKEQLQEFVIPKAIGDYIYIVEIHGFDNYRIIGKSRIDK